MMPTFLPNTYAHYEDWTQTEVSKRTVTVTQEAMDLFHRSLGAASTSSEDLNARLREFSTYLLRFNLVEEVIDSVVRHDLHEVDPAWGAF